MRQFINFTTNGQYLNLTQRDMEACLAADGVSWGLGVSEGVRPSDPFIPHRYLPTVRVMTSAGLNTDPVTTRRSIVMPLGTIVSAIPVLNREYYWQTNLSGQAAAVPGSESSLSGSVALGIGYDGTAITTEVDDTAEGYGEKINLAGVIANGGANAIDSYAAYDTEIGRVGADGNLIDYTSDTYTRYANIPLGVVTDNVVIDDNGAVLNFTENPFQRFKDFLCDWFIGVPYVVNGFSTTGGTVDVSTSSGSQATNMSTAYAKLRLLGMPFMWAANFADITLGNWVMPDSNGKYKPQYTGTALASASYSVNKTCQTVGKIVSIDNKFPKDLQDIVQVYNDSFVGGTAAYGLPHQLFLFVYWILRITNSSVPTYAEIVAAINSGYFGMARINLHVS